MGVPMATPRRTDVKWSEMVPSEERYVETEIVFVTNMSRKGKTLWTTCVRNAVYNETFLT